MLGLRLYAAGGGSGAESAETRSAVETLRARGTDLFGNSLRRPGPAVARRTYRRAYPAANDSSRTFDDLGRLNGLHIFADSMLGSLVSDGTAIGAIRSPPGVIGPVLRSPRRHPTWDCRTGFTRPYGKFSTTSVATLAGQQENCWARAVAAQASFRSQGSRRAASGRASSLRKLLRRKGEIFFGDW
jgi:hypothetical protein